MNKYSLIRYLKEEIKWYRDWWRMYRGKVLLNRAKKRCDQFKDTHNRKYYVFDSPGTCKAIKHWDNALEMVIGKRYVILSTSDLKFLQRENYDTFKRTKIAIYISYPD